jgi:NTP pyrophosphatase (non-canonical NTP hydrolase)
MDKLNALRNATMGMVGEAAETLEHMKKVLDQGHELNTEKLIEESGDTLWYIAKLARVCGITLEELAQRNVDKLKKRYPEGFDVNMSINRKE